jgi:hypothetical protein
LDIGELLVLFHGTVPTLDSARRRDAAPATLRTPSHSLRSFAGLAIVAASFAAFFIIFRALDFGQRQSEMWGALCAIGLWSILFWAVTHRRRERGLDAPLKREPIFVPGAPTLEWGVFWAIKVAVVVGGYYFLHR